MKTIIVIIAMFLPLAGFFGYFLMNKSSTDEPVDDDDYNDHTFI